MPKSVKMAPEYNINIPEQYFNPAFFPYLFLIYNYEIYWGGRGSGKSRFIAQKLVLQLSTTVGRNLIVMRKQATDCRNSCFAVIYKIIQSFKLQDMWDIRENPDMRMYNKVTHSEIIFTGMDKAENVKSLEFKEGNATDLWYEELTEQLIEDDITTLDNTIRDYDAKCRMIFSFNPPLNTFWIMGWLKNRLKCLHPEKTSTSIIEIDVNGVMVTMDCLIHHSTYRDNKWNFKIKANGEADYSKPGQYAAKLENLKFEDPYRYRTDCLGLPGTAGQSVFNANKVSDRIRALEDIYKNNPPDKINFAYDLDELDRPIMETVRSYYSDIGETKIYKEPNPKHPYVASIDPANEGEDYYAMHVFDNVTDEQVAVFHSQELGADCVLQCYGLLKMYYDPLVAPEANMGEFLIAKLKEWGYDNIYRRESPKDDYHDTLESKLGLRMSAGNRQFLIDNTIEWCKTNLNKINDLETLYEMITFTKQAKKNKGIFMGAEAGSHDDLVIALAILLKAKEQQSCEEQAEMKTIEGYWTMGELQVAIRQGRISEDTMREYLDRQKPRQGNTLRRKSRYAR